MLLTYQECINKYGSDYMIKKEIAQGNLYMKEKGIYSTERNSSELDVISRKYPRAVFTGKSAFYFHSLTDEIPDMYFLATKRSDTRISDPRVNQSFLKEEIFEAGIIEMHYNNSYIHVYNAERMLIELMRFRAKIPLDYYKAIISSYRKKVNEIDFSLVEEYASMFSNGNKLLEAIRLEVL